MLNTNNFFYIVKFLIIVDVDKPFSLAGFIEALKADEAQYIS